MILEMGLIALEPSSYFDKCGMKWKGNNLYTILPVRAAVDVFHQRQLRGVFRRPAGHFCSQCGQFTGVRGNLIPERKKSV